MKYIVLLFAILLYLNIASSVSAYGIRNGDFEQGFKYWQIRGEWHFVPYVGHAAQFTGQAGAICQDLTRPITTLAFQYRLKSGVVFMTLDGKRTRLTLKKNWQTQKVETKNGFTRICFYVRQSDFFALDNVEMTQ